VTLYDKWGDVINATFNWTAPSTLAAGASGSYDVTFNDHFSGWNSVLVRIHATAQ
jgi:hypothetical protein